MILKMITITLIFKNVKQNLLYYHQIFMIYDLILLYNTYQIYKIYQKKV